ncbi:MAG TPA: VTT domain-containing protein [Hyphomicrobiaceae bacterium]|nr:VTT domain-containing protein [Hyphomicrobiaceae bacterium]
MCRRCALPAIIAGILAVVLLNGWHHHLTLENVVTLRDRFQETLAANAPLALIAYVALYAVLVALSLPCGLLLTVAGGLLFGWLAGALAAIAGATLGAAIVFLVARSAVGDSLSKRAGPWLDKLSKGFQKDAMSYMLFLRLVPAFPFWFVNIAPAILGVPFRTFVLGTVVGIAPATLAFASAGAGLDSVILAAKNAHAACVALKGPDACPLKINASSLLTPELMLALVLVGLVALMPIMLRKWKKRKGGHAAAK